MGEEKRIKKTNKESVGKVKRGGGNRRGVVRGRGLRRRIKIREAEKKEGEERE